MWNVFLLPLGIWHYGLFIWWTHCWISDNGKTLTSSGKLWDRKQCSDRSHFKPACCVYLASSVTPVTCVLASFMESQALSSSSLFNTSSNWARANRIRSASTATLKVWNQMAENKCPWNKSELLDWIFFIWKVNGIFQPCYVNWRGVLVVALCC